MNLAKALVCISLLTSKSQYPGAKLTRNHLNPHKLLPPTSVPLYRVSDSPLIPTLTSSECSCWLWKVKTWDAKKERTLHCNAKKLKSQKCSQKSQQWSIFSRSSRCPSHPLARPSSSVGRPSGLNVSSPGPSFPKYTHVRQPGRALDRLARNMEASLHNPRQPAYIGPRGRHPRWTR